MLEVILLTVMLTALAIFWLCRQTSRESRFTVTSSASSQALHQYLSLPTNLASYHPTINKVTVIKREEEITRCMIEEDLRFLGKCQAALAVSTSQNIPSPAESCISMEFTTKDATVIVNLIITPLNEAGVSKKSKIEVTISIASQRFITILFINNLTQKWLKSLEEIKRTLEER